MSSANRKSMQSRITGYKKGSAKRGGNIRRSAKSSFLTPKQRRRVGHKDKSHWALTHNKRGFFG